MPIVFSVITILFTALAVAGGGDGSPRHQPVSIVERQNKTPECCLLVHADLTRYIHHIWTSDHGLPQNSAYSLCQTSDGYLWIGTTEGLVRYDGARFVVFHTINTPAFRHNWVTALALDSQGALWVGTRGGLVRYEKGSFTSFSTSQGLNNEHIRTISYDKNHDQLLIGTFGGGVQVVKNGVISALSGYTQEPGLLINALALDKNGGVWIGTQGRGLDYILHGVTTHYTTANGLAHSTVHSLLSDSNGTMWVGTAAGLQNIHQGRFTAYSPKGSHGKVFGVLALYQDCDRSLWVGTEGDGVYRLSGNKWTMFRESDGLSGNFVLSLLQDHHGAVWIGTQGSGINRLQNSAFTTFTTQNGLSSNIVRPIFQSSDNSVWIGTVRGLNRFEVKNKQIVSNNGVPDGVVILSIAEELNNNAQKPIIWTGTRGSGLYKLYNGTTQQITTKHGLSNDVVTSLFVEQKTGMSDAVVWAGTLNGLNRIEQGNIQSFGIREGLENTAISCIVPARDARGALGNSLWIGTQGGLYHLNAGKFTALTTANGLAHNHVISLYQDSSGALWVGSYGGGITLIRNGRLTKFTVHNGLFDNTAMCIVEDNDGHLWISCNKGIYRVKKQDLLDVAEGRRPAVVCRAFGRADGMKSVECNGGNQPAGWKTSDGALWFPTIAGVVMIDPRRLHADPFIPTVIVEEVLTNNIIQSTNEPITMNPEYDKVEFRYTATSLVAPERVQFRYMLEGFDKHWVEAGSRRTAYYTNLPRGRQYNFRVMACNSDGLWNPVAASAILYLTPYFWETWWFYTACSVVLVIVVVGLVRWWVLRLQRRAEELESIVDERTYKVLEQNLQIQHTNSLLQEKNKELDAANRFKTQMLSIASHDLKNPLTTIMGLAQLLERQSPEDSIGKEYSQDILTVCRQMHSLVLDLLDTAAKDLEKVELQYLNSSYKCERWNDEKSG